MGASWEAGLPEQILADVSGSPGTLPLLQYALTELFAARADHQLTHQVYLQNGGVLGALAGRAEEAFARLDASQGALARQLFLRLVTVRSAGESTQRRARLVELNALGDPGEVEAILATFGDARLLVFDRDDQPQSHRRGRPEALVTGWPRPVGSIDEAGRIPFYTVVCEMGWVMEDRDREAAYPSQVADWPSSTPGRGPSPTSRSASSEIDFLEDSREEAHRQRSRRRRRRNLITAGFGAAAVIAGIFAFSATRNAEIAESRELGCLGHQRSRRRSRTERAPRLGGGRRR